jgi:hypothetical protein
MAFLVLHDASEDPHPTGVQRAHQATLSLRDEVQTLTTSLEKIIPKPKNLLRDAHQNVAARHAKLVQQLERAGIDISTSEKLEAVKVDGDMFRIAQELEGTGIEALRGLERYMERLGELEEMVGRMCDEREGGLED